MWAQDAVEPADACNQYQCRIRGGAHRLVQRADVTVLIGQGRWGLRDEVCGPDRLHAGTNAVSEALEQCAEPVLHPLRRIEVDVRHRNLHLLLKACTGCGLRCHRIATRYGGYARGHRHKQCDKSDHLLRAAQRCSHQSVFGWARSCNSQWSSCPELELSWRAGTSSWPRATSQRAATAPVPPTVAGSAMSRS